MAVGWASRIDQNDWDQSADSQLKSGIDSDAPESVFKAIAAMSGSEPIRRTECWSVVLADYKI